MPAHRVVIVGTGFAGIWAALGAAAARQAAHAEQDIEITVVGPGDSLLIRPRLYELDLRGTRVPLQGILPQIQVRHVDGMVNRVLPDQQRVQAIGVEGEELVPYDQLVLCAGSRRAVELEAPRHHGVDNLAEAQALHAVLDSFGKTRPIVAVVGAGFEGIEVATELTGRADVHLIEQADHVAPDFGPAARDVIEKALRDLNIAVTLEATATPLDDGNLSLSNGTYLTPNITVWATGPHAGNIGAAFGIQHDELGRIPVDQTLQTTVDGVWAAGDCARAVADRGHLALMSCQHAMPMGARAGSNVVRGALGLRAERYSQPLYLTCLDLGAGGALLTAGFERNDVLATGESGKQFKRYINRGLIYPPSGDAHALLKLGAARQPSGAVAAVQRRALRSAALRRGITRGEPDRASQHLTT